MEEIWKAKLHQAIAWHAKRFLFYLKEHSVKLRKNNSRY
jgi:hypothetical protein